MDEDIVESFKKHVELLHKKASAPKKCEARLKNGPCKINATCGRFCKRHQHLENHVRYMVRPGADADVVYHNHPPLIECGQGCPRFAAIVCT